MVEDDELTEQQRRIKKQCIERRGFWLPQDNLLLADPEFLEHYLNLSAHPKDVLGAKLKHLIHIAIDCAVTHLHVPATRAHIKMALEDHGATFWEILQVIELASTIGIHSAVEGSRILREAWENGEATGTANIEHGGESSVLGSWMASLENVEHFDEEWYEYAVKYWEHPFENGPLDPIDQELVCIAVCVASTYLYSTGVQRHVENALGHGATPEKIMAAIEVASVLGMHTASDTVPALVEEARACGKLPESIQTRED